MSIFKAIYISCSYSLILFLFYCLCVQEAQRLEPVEDQSSYNYVDYSEKRSLPISIPDYHYLEKDGERYVVSIINLIKKLIY